MVDKHNKNTNTENEKISKNWFNLLVGAIKENLISSILELILYIIPFIVVYPKANNFIVNNHYIVFLMILIFLINIYLKVNNKEKFENIKNKNKKLKEELLKNQAYSESIGLFLADLPSEFLQNVSKFLNLNNSERISLYVLFKDNFLIIGRYSENPEYNEYRRDTYPADCGYISLCLRNDNGKEYYCRTGLPSDLSKYLEEVKKDTGMNEDDIKNIRMKSRSYFTKVIKDLNNKNVGILVIESKKPKLPMSSDELNEKLKELSVQHMSTFLNISNKLKGDAYNG